jgi:hypothetical protein
MDTLTQIIKEIDRMYKATTTLVNIHIGTNFARKDIADCLGDPIDTLCALTLPRSLHDKYPFLARFYPIYCIGTDGIVYTECEVSVNDLDKAFKNWSGPGPEILLKDLTARNNVIETFIDNIFK